MPHTTSKSVSGSCSTWRPNFLRTDVIFLRICCLRFVLDQAGVVHPDHVRGEDPREHEHVDGAENETSEREPGEPRQGLKERVMELNPFSRAPGEQSAEKAEHIRDFCAHNAEPAVS